MLAALAAPLALGQAPACAPLPGSDALWRDGTRFIFIGETHGTVEAPAAFADLVCLALERGPVTAALEFPTAMQPTLDAFMAAETDAAARAVLLDYPYGPFRFHDGRGSEAMMAMLLRLRALRRDGRPLTVVATVPDSPRLPGFGQSYAELDRAAVWVEAARARPDDRVLVFVGRVHAEKTRRVGSPIGLPAAAHIRPEDSLSLAVARQGGEAWLCRDECGVAAITPVDDAAARGVVLSPDLDPAFDGLLALGPWTASPPAPRDQPLT
ncbi:MAG: hypothetical protein ACK4JY_08050 [Brevundimonas sp.]|uniref:hypothetical protein n=1 Tax=Brevundimonas sp. TaxID=1871086 RepID=UPI00391BE3C7